MNWIKTSERLPEIDIPVLLWPLKMVCHRSICSFTKKDIWDDGNGRDLELISDRATHWALIPEPLKD